MSADADTVEFRAMINAECSWHRCDRPAEEVAIVTGDYGIDGLAGYCSWCADGLSVQPSHEFIGEVQR